MCEHTHACKHMYTCMYVCVSVHVCIWVLVHTRVCVCIWVLSCAHVCVCVRVCVCARAVGKRTDEHSSLIHNPVNEQDQLKTFMIKSVDACFVHQSTRNIRLGLFSELLM